MRCSPSRNADCRRADRLPAADLAEAAERDEVGELAGARVAAGLHVRARDRGSERGRLAVDHVGEDRAERRDAGGDADLAERRVDPRGHARAVRLDDADRGGGQRRVDRADAAAGDHEPGEQRGPVVAGLDPAHQQQSDADEGEAAGDEPAHAVALGELARERRDEEREQRHGEEAQAGLERRVAEHVLHVERQVQEHREHRRRQREGGDRGAVERGLAEQRQVEHRRALRARSATQNATSRTRGADEQRDDQRSTPALGVAADEREDEAEQRRRRT